jgi:hypothetical protein
MNKKIKITLIIMFSIIYYWVLSNAFYNVFIRPLINLFYGGM